MTQAKLLASSNTVEGILSLVCAYWYAPKGAYSIKDGRLYSESKQDFVIGYRVVPKSRRYRFEKCL